jgi:hypothetical protein
VVESSPTFGLQLPPTQSKASLILELVLCLIPSDDALLLEDFRQQQPRPRRIVVVASAVAKNTTVDRPRRK